MLTVHSVSATTTAGSPFTPSAADPVFTLYLRASNTLPVADRPRSEHQGLNPSGLPLAASSRLARWPQLHIARGALLAQCGHHADAIAAYRDALALEPAAPVRRHITSQIAALESAAPAPTQET